MNSANLLADLPERLPAELVTTLLQADGIRIERIVSHGHVSLDGFWYDQDQHEWVMVVQGEARLRFENGIMEMKAGDFVNIPAHTKHRVEWTTLAGPTIWLAVHCGDADMHRSGQAT
jgi:cupin 2 domain-containing protein